MPQVQGKQIADAAITNAKLATDSVAPGAKTQNVSDGGSGIWNFAATKLVLDGVGVATMNDISASSAGLDPKESAVVATAAALPACTPAGTGPTHTLTGNASAILAVDGVNTVLNDRILVKNQADPTDDGIYKVTTEGTAGVAFVLTRATDADSIADMNEGAHVFIEEGTANGLKAFVCTATTGSTMDTDYDTTWGLFSVQPSIMDGGGLSETAGVLEVACDDSSIELSDGTGSATVRVKASGVTNAMLAGSIVDTKLNTITTASKVSGSAVQLGANSGLADSTGLVVSFGADVGACDGSGTANGTSATSARSDHEHDIPVADKADKAANPTGATSGDDEDTGLAIANTPIGYVEVRVNGLCYEVGDGVKTKDCYYTGDAGTNARAFGAIVTTDELYWNGVIAGFDLATSDEIDQLYHSMSG